MIPDILDSNSYLLRDYSGFVRNLTDKLPNLTDKWTDLTVSEPDTIFLNNIAYTNDILSYVIDYRYELTSVKYTQNRDFLNSVCALTGGSIPFYEEKYSIVIKNTSAMSSIFIPKGTCLFDSHKTQAVTTLKDVYALPNSENEVAVVVGYPYNSSLPTMRNSQITAKETVNSNLLYDVTTFDVLQTEKNSSKVFYNFLLNGQESYWVSPGDASLCVMSPYLEHLSYKFAGFATEQENNLLDSAEILYPKLNGSIIFAKTKAGEKPKDINDYKVAYLQSLSEIYTDINTSVFEHNLDYQTLPGVFRLALSYENNRNSFITSSYISYTEGYIDIRGQVPLGTKINIAYDFYNNDDPLRMLKNKALGFTTTVRDSMSIDLELEENHTIKAFSTVIKMELPTQEILFLTDYNNQLILPRGPNSYRWFRYCLKDSLSVPYISGQSQDSEYFLKTVFSAGNVVQVGETSVAGVYEYSIFIPTQQATILHVFDYLANDWVTVSLPANNLMQTFTVTSRPRSTILIKDATMQPLYRAYTNSNTMWVVPDEERVVETNDLPNLVFHNGEKIYFLLPITNGQTELNGLSATVTLDGICSYQTYSFNLKSVSNRNTYDLASPSYYTRIFKWKDNPLGITNLFCLYLPSEYKDENDEMILPQTVSLTVAGKTYYSNSANTSALNDYSSLSSSGVLRNNIDLYDLPTIITAAKVRTIDVSAKVYLKPLDLANSYIEELIKTALREYSDSLQIGERISASAILSTIIHASEYIAYVELDSETAKKADITLSYHDLKETIHQIGKVTLSFRNPDILQF